MQTFEWVDAKSVEQASELVTASTKEKPVLLKAGGLDLMDLMKEGIITPSRLVNLKTVPGLDKIEQQATNGDRGWTYQAEFRIGALVTLNTLDKSPVIRKNFPALSEACGHAATPQVRHAATIGGNLCQKPRCWYYRNDHFHVVDGDPIERVKQGENQYHAIFDTDKSPMVQASTPATALLAYGAKLEIETGGKPSVIDLEKFYRPATMDSTSDTNLPAGAVIRNVLLPVFGATMPKSAYTKQTERESYDWPICDVAVVLGMDGQTVKSASIVMGWVAPTPRRATAAEQVLAGKVLTEDLAKQAAKAAVADAKPLSKNAYKVPILEAVVRRTIMKCM